MRDYPSRMEPMSSVVVVVAVVAVVVVVPNDAVCVKARACRHTLHELCYIAVFLRSECNAQMPRQLIMLPYSRTLCFCRIQVWITSAGGRGANTTCASARS